MDNQSASVTLPCPTCLGHLSHGSDHCDPCADCRGLGQVCACGGKLEGDEQQMCLDCEDVADVAATVTDDQLHALQLSGDSRQYALALRALNGSLVARAECARLAAGKAA